VKIRENRNLIESHWKMKIAVKTRKKHEQFVLLLYSMLLIITQLLVQLCYLLTEMSFHVPGHSPVLLRNCSAQFMSFLRFRTSEFNVVDFLVQGHGRAYQDSQVTR